MVNECILWRCALLIYVLAHKMKVFDTCFRLTLGFQPESAIAIATTMESHQEQTILQTVSVGVQIHPSQ